MKKTLIGVVSATMLLAGCTTGGNTPKKELNVYAFGPMIPQEVMDNFKAETNIQVNLKEASSDEEIFEALKKNDASEYDLIIVDEYILEPMIAQDMVDSLDVDSLSNLENVDPVYQGHYFDPENEYTVPYGAGMQTIIYNTDLVDVDIKGFDDLLDPSLKDNVGIVDNMLIMMGLSLISNGEEVGTSDLVAVQAAGDKLMKFAPNVHAIQEAGLDESLISEEIAVGLTYTYEVNNVLEAAKENGMHFKVVYPQEGIGYGMMEQAIPKNAKNKEEAHMLIDYMLQPEVAKMCIEMVGFSTNLETNKLYTDDEKITRTLPSDFDTSKLQLMTNPTKEAMDLRFKLADSFKNACGK